MRTKGPRNAALQCVVLAVPLWLAECGQSPGLTNFDAGAGGSSGAGSGSSGATSSGASSSGGGASGSSSSGGGSSGGSSSGSGGRSSGGSSSGNGGSGSGSSSGGGSGSGSSSSGSSGASSSGGSSSGGASDAGANCPGTVRPGDSTQTITSGNISRSFIVHVPTGYTGSSRVPVVFDFHPLGSTGSGQEGSTGWRQKGDSAGFITVFPNGVGNSWNVGRCCSNAQSMNVDDVQFTRDMIKWLETNACVDSKRIYASGGSNGGGMAFMLACHAADVVAAVAPVDFDCITAPGGPTAMPTCACTLPRPISVTQFRATGDTAVPYNGGMTPVGADCPPGGTCSTFDFPGAMTTFTTWQGFDMCTGSPTTNPNNAKCQTVTACGAGTQVTLCTQQGGGHLQNYTTLDIVNTAWTMFQNEALP